MFFPFPVNSREFGLRIAGMGGYSVCRKGMLGGLVVAYLFLWEE